MSVFFLKIENPVLIPGSEKWWGLKKWGYYIRMFFAIANPDGYNLFLTPGEYISFQGRYPRIMAILLEIQQAVRKQVVKEMPKPGKTPGKIKTIGRRRR